MTTDTTPAPATPRAALRHLADRISADPGIANRYPSVVAMLKGESNTYPTAVLPTEAPPLYTIPTAYADLTQDAVNAAVRGLFARYWEAEEATERLQEVADHAQDAANEAEKHKDGINQKIQDLCDAIRTNRPDLTIPEP